MLSPFSPHLGTNYSASELEKTQIRQLLKRPIEENQRIDSEIEELRQRLEALIHKREENARFIEPHLALLAPIRGLPDEILRTIFSHCLPTPARFSEDPFDNQAYMSATQAPMLLTFICQRWRQIALDCPELWQRAPITISPSAHHFTDWDLAASQLAQLWLSRARNRPVAISISWKLLSAAPTNFKKFLPFITQSSSQWEELRISGPGMHSGLLNSILSLPSSSIPNLRNLEIPCIRGSLEQTYDNKRLLGGPSIRGFRYEGVYDEGFMKIPLQWSQLTYLHIASLNTTDTNIRKILAECPRLERCHTCISTVEIPEPYPSPRLPLSHLASLHMRHTAPDPPTGFFASLHLPSLKDITLSTTDLGVFPPAAVVGETLATLRRLAVWTIRSSTAAATEAMLETFALSTQLEYLEIGYISATYTPYILCSDTVLAALTPRKGENPSASPNSSSGGEPQHAGLMGGPNYSSYLCPNLQDIKLHVIGRPIADEAIFDFIKGRRERSTSLRSVSLVYASRYVGGGAKDRQGVNVLGVKVNIKYQDRAM
ncbi:hypothetical protein D9611_002958 [Ephemerocybe angulata]|uniref:F-box domain-containing protein n=1 Tax=Ephemerocybe angulata TaxID=980116 RepID=A0A8H5FI70_9AGAR|nr:hypothetical protein D9611_002958 [Tulosesus angulatus]